MKSEQEGWAATPGPDRTARRKIKSARTAQGYSGAGGGRMDRLETTIFATLGEVRRCGGQAFFDKCLSIRNRMAASSYCRQSIKKLAALIFSKPPEMSMIKNCYTTAFFFCRRAAVFQIISLIYSKLE